MTDTTTTTTITIEQLEALAAQIEADQAKEVERLHRLVAVYARILAAREPGKFAAKPLERSDEDGHWDNSFPPKVKYKDFTGPRLLRLRGRETDDVSTSGGFYYHWRRVTTDGGLYVDRHGQLWRSEETGTGKVGQFAAYPGDCDVMCTIEYERADDDVTVEELRAAEEKMRGLAFPLAAAVTA